MSEAGQLDPKRAAAADRLSSASETLAGVVRVPGWEQFRWLRHGFSSIRAQLFARAFLALSVAIPVLAYICLYSFEISTNARRDLMLFTHPERFQMLLRL